MLTEVLAHAGRPLAPHDLWGAWKFDVPLLAGVVVVVWAYRRGRLRGPRRASDDWRGRCFAGGTAVVVLALVSPLDALSGALASAHMVQHVLLLLVAAPLLALASPGAALVRGAPQALRQATGRWRRRLRPLRNPAALWALHVATIWVWHAGVPYDAALDHHLVHVAEHASFVVTGLLFWQVVLGARGAVSNGLGILLVFTMAMQSVFLSALLTFASSPWYSGYAASTAAWDLEPLADQQLAGVIMWIPAGLVYLGAALGLLVRWIQATERDPALA
ncbi:MAG TPA: cytochrome c oxidase assembly protein [Acidimicrobiales bacterium]|nr:cytochrome c oxidase assembly protein [Acidimicrobiales bacterium]